MAYDNSRCRSFDGFERAYGSRSRTGLISPSDNTVIKTEMWALAPEGVSIHTSRLLFGDPSEGGHDNMDTHLPRALRELRTADVTAIAYACTSSSFDSGPEEMISRIRETSGLPTVATFGSLMAALSHLDIKRVSLGTPYPRTINEAQVSALEARGIQVVAEDSVLLFPEQEHLTGIAKIPLEAVQHLACTVDRPEAEDIVLSCTDLPTLPLIASLEAELGKPVITICQATAWEVFRASGIAGKLHGAGRLFEAT